MAIVAVKEQIADVLRSEIISGELSPNQKLTEEVLAQRFGVSRGRIRDVLLELSKEGLLVLRANRGTTVNEIAPPELQALLIKLRLQIEAYAIQTVTKSADEDFLAELRSAMEQLSRALETDDFTEITKADIAFHRTIVAGAGDQDLVNLWQPIIMRMRMNYQRIGSPADAVEEHEKIFNAICAGDTKAALEALKGNVR